MNPTPHSFRRALHQLAEVAEGLHRRKTIRLQDQLGFQIRNAIQRRAVRVGRRASPRSSAFRALSLGDVAFDLSLPYLWLFFIFSFCLLVFLVFAVLTHKSSLRDLYRK